MTMETVISHLRFSLEANASTDRQVQRVHLRPSGVVQASWQRCMTLHGGTHFPECMRFMLKHTETQHIYITCPHMTLYQIR